MSRKKTQPKKNVVPDPKFKSTIIPKLINNIMYDGKEVMLINIKKILNRTFNTPASRVRGSPITGTQANNKDQRPYF